MEKTKAEQMWEYWGKFDEFESQICLILTQNDINFSDLSHDSYDWSLEITYVNVPLPDKVRKELWDFGFRQVWTHSKTRFSEGNEEKHYQLWKEFEKKK